MNVNVKNLIFLSEVNGTIANLGVDNTSCFYPKEKKIEPNSNEASKVVDLVRELLFKLNEDPDNFLRNANLNVDVFKSILIEKILPSGLLSGICFFQLRNLQNILIPELKNLRSRKNEARTDREEEIYQLQKAIAKAELMFLLKVGITVNKGCSGSLLISWFNNKKIGIFKAELPKENYISLFKSYIERAFGLQESHLTTSHMAKPKAEVAAYILDRHFDINITCPTTLQTFANNQGSFQLFAHNMCEAREITPLLEEKFDFDELEIKNFQLMVVLDYLIGDLDGHEENWLIRKGKRGCLIKEIKKIDNANAFPQKNPESGYFSSLNDIKQYIWSKLKIAKIEFKQPIKELMLRITREEIEIVVNKIKNQLPNFLDSDMIKLLYQRAKVIEIIGDLENVSPSIFGGLKSDKQINDFITDRSPPKANILSFDEDEFVYLEESPPKRTKRNSPSNGPLLIFREDYSD